MSLLSTFASNLKHYRTERGLSQEEFADIAGLHRTYISAVEREKRSIALDNVEKIALALEIDAYLLFVDNSKGSSSKIQTKEVR
jgi:transcriptional regulator with XRE-family HTH domain